MGRRVYLLASAVAVAAIGSAVGFVLTRSKADTPTPPFLPPAASSLPPSRLLTAASMTPRALTTAAPRVTRHFEYVFPDREMDVYDIDHGFRLVERVALPAAHALRGDVLSTSTHTLYLSLGGDGGSTGTGSLLKIDLLTNRIEWERMFPTGVDSPAITPDGKTLYLPTGERATGDIWYVVDAGSGRVLSLIHGDLSPHNTIVGPDGGRVYLGPRNGTYLVVASTKTNEVIRRIGPLKQGV